MKNFKSVSITSLVMMFVLSFSACKKDDIENAAGNDAANGNIASGTAQSPLVFPVQAKMYGKSYPEWVAKWWKWNLQFNCAHFPLQYVDGSRQNQNQAPPVFFLSGRRGNTLNVMVPAGSSLFFPAITYYEERPAVVSGVEQDLYNSVSGFTDLMDQVSLTIDGQSVDVSKYKVLSPMFVYSANADLANCYDADILGGAQPFLAGGYFFMLKPLSAGSHTIRRVGGASAAFPFVYDITYNITQQ